MNFNIAEKINDILWSVPVFILMIGGGIYLSLKLSFPQKNPLKVLYRTIFSLFDKNKSSKNGLSKLESFSIALAATVGTGSIIGVASAMAIGGAGAVFWMWVSAFIGMGTAYYENYLGVKFSRKNHICGAMSYLKTMGKNTAVVYAAFSVLVSLGMGNMAQASAIVNSAYDGFKIPTHITGIILLIFMSLILTGRSHSGEICAKIVPFMAVFFISGSLYIIIKNYNASFKSLMFIIKSAFDFKSAAGGTVGTFLTYTVIGGIKRGVFSHEAGLGSSVAAHNSCGELSPKIQGTWAMAEVFIDTFIICTITALVILISGVSPEKSDCIALAYSNGLGSFGKYFISFSLILFAFATLNGWFFIGENSWKYIFPNSHIAYKIIFLIFICIGCVKNMQSVLTISDIFNGLLAIPNLIFLLINIKSEKFSETT